MAAHPETNPRQYPHSCPYSDPLPDYSPPTFNNSSASWNLFQHFDPVTQTSIHSAINSAKSLRDTLASRKQRLLEVVDQIDERLKTVQGSISHLNAVISPWKRMPNELWVRIFLMCNLPLSNEDRWRTDLGSFWPDPRYNPIRRPPWTISHVCRRWRDIAIGYPSLWKHIILPCTTRSPTLFLIRLMFLRSGKELVHLAIGVNLTSLKPVLAQDVMDTIIPHAHRWEILDCEDVSGQYLPSALSLPNLRHVAIRQCVDHAGGVRRLLSAAPLLREVDISLGFVTGGGGMPGLLSVPHPWNTLTALGLSIPVYWDDQLVGILVKCPRLETLRLNITRVLPVDGNGSTPRTSKIILSSLVSFRLLGKRPCSSTHAILSSLRCPNLQDLIISDLRNLSPIVDLIKTSSCNISRLEIRGGTVDESILGLLERTPHLEMLRLIAKPRDTPRNKRSSEEEDPVYAGMRPIRSMETGVLMDKLFRFLTIRKESIRRVITPLPRLSTLALGQWVSELGRRGTLHTMLRSRFSPPSGSPAKKLEFVGLELPPQWDTFPRILKVYRFRADSESIELVDIDETQHSHPSRYLGSETEFRHTASSGESVFSGVSNLQSSSSGGGRVGGGMTDSDDGFGADYYSSGEVVGLWSDLDESDRDSD